MNAVLGPAARHQHHHGALNPAVDLDRHRCEDRRPAFVPAGRNDRTASQRPSELGAHVLVALGALTGRDMDDGGAGGVDDADLGARACSVAIGQARQVVGLWMGERFLGEHTECNRVALGLSGKEAMLPAGCDHGEGDLEPEQDEHGEAQVGEEQASSHRSASATVTRLS
jgi:hypothetical protein